MKRFATIAWCFGLLAVAGCEKDFNVNSKGAGNQMVLNALFNDSYPVELYVSQPYPVGTANDNIVSIPDARVELYENGIFKEVMNYVPSDSLASFGGYFSASIPQQGKAYTVKVSRNGYATAGATDTVPRPAAIIASVLNAYQDTVGKGSGEALVVFRDDISTQNYYRLNVWINGVQRQINNHDTTYAFVANAIEPWPQVALSDTVRDGYFLLFSDKGFNGLEKQLQFNFTPVQRATYVSLDLYIELHTVSKSHYDYFNTLNLYRYAPYSSEPVFVFSNVTNGLGDFVAEHIQTMHFRLK